MWTETISLLAMTFLVVQGISDPCSPGNYQEIDEKRRSTGFKTEYPEVPLCDITLVPGWYRFTSGAGGQMPEQCVPRLQCGTVVPVWLNGTHPTVAEGMVARQACANFETGSSTPHPCCEHSLQIGVKNCGTFYVYYLKATPSCPIAYCAGDRAPCPIGKWSVSGFPPCKDAFPKITTPPQLTGPEIVGRTFRFACHIDWAPQDPDQVFEVTWTFDNKEDPSIQTTFVSDPDRVAYLDGASLQGHLGTNVGCKIRAFYAANANMTSAWLESNTYWAGIRTEPARIEVSEKEESRNVTLTSTLPIICDHSLQCCVTLKLDVDGDKNNIATTHECLYELCSTDWDPVSKEASVDVPIVATKDQITDGDKDLLLRFETVLSAGGGQYLATYDGYRLQSTQVDVKDADTKSCVWTGDPHIHGMEHGGTYHLFRVGDYTMYENPNRDLEIQARTWPCNGGHVTCICGVTIREKDDVIRINECDQPYKGQHTSPKVEVASNPLREGTIVQRSTDGKHIAVYLPSGTEVKIDATNFYLNTYLTIPSGDLNEGRGVCGTFDGNTHNEFTRRDGRVEQDCTAGKCVPENFTETWSNPKSESLFETLPPRTNDPYVPTYCQCDEGVTGAPRVNCTARGDLPTQRLQCPGCVPMGGNLPSFLNPNAGWTRRAASPVYADLDEQDPPFDIDSYRNFQPVAGNWPTASGITEQMARAKCEAALRASQLWAHCGSNSKLKDNNMEDCILDIQYGDTFDMVEAAVLAFTSECQMELAKDPNNYVTSANGKNVLKPELSSDVCSVFCSRHGRCERGRCVCHHGYTGDNCQLEAEKGPQLARIRSNSTCDVNVRPCRKVYIDASNFEMKDTLACKVQEIRPDGSLSDEVHMEEAEFLSSGRLACSLPESRVKTAASRKTFAISATNDGRLYGNQLTLTVFDSSCLNCDDAGCTQRTDACMINGLCHQDGDLNPDDVTHVCDVTASTDQWSVKPTPAGNYPAVSAPVLSGPDDDRQMACEVFTSDASPEARFQVTWYVAGQPRTTETLTPDMLISFYSSFDLPHAGQLTCKVRSFYAGQAEFSPALESKPFDLTNLQN